MKMYWRVAAHGVLLLALLATAGCDSNDAEDDSDFAVFTRESWTVTEFFVSGSDLTANLDARYENVVFSFVENDNENTRSFDLIGTGAGDGPNLNLSGRIRIEGDNDIIFFIPDDEPGFDLDYVIESTGRIALFSDDTNPSGATLRDLLLNSSIGGEFPEVRMTIEERVENTN